MINKKNKVLDIGSGSDKTPGAISLDFNAKFHPDVVHNLNIFPYPFKSNQFNSVNIKSVLFLLNDSVKVMEEIYRISRNNATVLVIQPYFRSQWNYVDPWVKNFGTVHSFRFYDPNDIIFKRYQYTDAKFVTSKILFDEYILKPKISHKFLIWFANKYPRQYEKRLSHFFPLDMISFYLKVIK